MTHTARTMAVVLAVGMLSGAGRAHAGPTDTPLPTFSDGKPALAVYTNACNTYIKWAEIWERMYEIPTFTLDVPGTRADGRQTWPGHQDFEHDRAYVLAQLRELIPICESVSVTGANRTEAPARPLPRLSTSVMDGPTESPRLHALKACAESASFTCCVTRTKAVSAQRAPARQKSTEAMRVSTPFAFAT